MFVRLTRALEMLVSSETISSTFATFWLLCELSVDMSDMRRCRLFLPLGLASRFTSIRPTVLPLRCGVIEPAASATAAGGGRGDIRRGVSVTELRSDAGARESLDEPSGVDSRDWAASSRARSSAFSSSSSSIRSSVPSSSCSSSCAAGVLGEAVGGAPACKAPPSWISTFCRRIILGVGVWSSPGERRPEYSDGSMSLMSCVSAGLEVVARRSRK